MLMFKSSRLVYYPFADSSLFLTITLILGFFTLLSSLQVCVWQESTSSGSRAVLPQVSDSFSASAVVVLDGVSWQQAKTIPLHQAGSCFLGICYLATGHKNYWVKQTLGSGKSLLLCCVHPAPQSCFVWLWPTWHISLLTLSSTFICTFWLSLSCYCGWHTADFVSVAL